MYYFGRTSCSLVLFRGAKLLTCGLLVRNHHTTWREDKTKDENVLLLNVVTVWEFSIHDFSVKDLWWQTLERHKEKYEGWAEVATHKHTYKLSEIQHYPAVSEWMESSSMIVMLKKQFGAIAIRQYYVMYCLSTWCWICQFLLPSSFWLSVTMSRKYYKPATFFSLFTFAVMGVVVEQERFP